MKKRFLVLIISMIMILCNSMAAYAAESTEGDYVITESEEETSDNAVETEEESYPSHFFNDTTIPGIIIEANVGEGIIPAQTTIRTKLVSSEVEETVRKSIEDFFNGDQKAVKITAVDITFMYNNEIIDPKGTITFIMRSDTVLEGANHVVVCLKDGQKELMPAIQSITDEYALNEEGISLRKKEVSFELNGGNAIIAIVEIEEAPANQKKTETPETPTQQNETGKTAVPAEQNETGKTAVPAEQNETGKTAVPAEQSETGKTAAPAGQNETGKTEVPAEQSETGKTTVTAEQNETGKTAAPAEQSETGKTAVPAEQEKTGKTAASTEQKETGKNEKPSDKKETEGSETSSKQKETEDSVDKNEKINIVIEIVFDDNKNQDGMRPNYRIAVLKSNGLEKAEIRISEEDNWKGSFENLPKYEEGKEVDYDVEVTTPYPYERVSNNSSNNFIFEFKHIPENVSINGKVIWKDSALSSRPDGKIKVTLFEDEIKKSEIETSKENNWEYNFGEYPKYKEAKKIHYRVEIEPIDGYYTYYSEDNYNITNEYIEKNNSNSDNVSPKSGDINNNNVVIFAIVLVISIVGIVLIGIKNKK